MSITPMDAAREIPKAYEPTHYEDAWYRAWEESGLFNPDTTHSTASPSEKSTTKSFTIAMPPPNATGVLHIGHALMLAIQDLMVRYHRMHGEATLWIPGTDHASIATQNKVEKLLAQEGLTRHMLGHDAFLNRVHEFVEESRSTIRSQIRKMGSSCDWSREHYTLDEQCSKAVREIFVRMYEDGLIYRGSRIVHWCPRDTSTLADDEVEYKEIAGKLYHLKYPIKGTDRTVTVATTRPETLLGDVAIAVNPHDERYTDLIGHVAQIPLGGREIPIIADEYVEKDFGTGVLKITPAHDPNDFTIGTKYHLPTIRVINEVGAITLAGLPAEHRHALADYEGIDRMEAREKVIADLLKSGHVEKIEDYTHSVGFCYRCGTLIEPLISLQWFVAVDKKIPGRGKSLKELTHEAVSSGAITITPQRFDKIYFNWIDNLRDWCISRQIWFGHRIPVYYCETKGCGETIVARETPAHCPKCHEAHLRQDEDTLDTWFSSGLWTFSTLGWPDAMQENKGAPTKTGDLARFHPTAVIETGADILFFWVARMIMMSTYTLSEIPFRQIYLHGMVLDQHGKKMSKSKEETAVDPMSLITKYGTDALRLSMIEGITPGNSLRITEEKLEGARNLVNKIWNIARYSIEHIAAHPEPTEDTLTDLWIKSRLAHTITEVTRHIERAELSQAAETLRAFTTDELADWYLEVIKVEGGKRTQLTEILHTLIALWHPILPFVTEEIYSHLAPHISTDLKHPATTLLMGDAWPSSTRFTHDTQTEARFTTLRTIITSTRNARTEHHIPPAKKINAIIYAPYHGDFIRTHEAAITRLARLEQISLMEGGEKPAHAIYIKVQEIEVFLPLDMMEIAHEAERLEKERTTLQGLLTTLQARLADPTFAEKAPARIVEAEQQKVVDYQDKIAKLTEQITHLRA